MISYQRIKNLAESRGYKITEVERKCGFGRSSIIKWDKNIPSIDKVEKVADLFGVSIDYLVEHKVNEETLSDEEKSMLAMYRSMNDEGKAELSNYAAFTSSKSIYKKA